MAAPHSLVDQAKQRARTRARAARAGLDPALGAKLAGHVLQHLPPAPGTAVSGFWPMAGEIDLRPLLTNLHRRGHPVLLPVTPPRGQKLRFRAWTPDTPMMREDFGTFCPWPDAEEGVPQTLFVPLLAFDRAGRRLGYGGGYYDRTLAALPGAVAIGCGFAAQEMAEVPSGRHDIRLSAIATEQGVILCDPT